jgi:LacI family transcriptional regulator
MAVINTSDLAKKLGLTRVTVSRAINNDPRVAEKTRQKVLAAMKDHCLEPNAIARALVRGRTLTIGLMIGTDLGTDYFNEINMGLEPELEVRGFSVLMGMARFRPERERTELSAMLARRVEGILSQPLAGNRDYYSRLIKQGMPIVFVADYLDIPGASWVVSDTVADARLAMNHLLELGHRRIAYLGPRSPSAQMLPRPRMYRQVLREAGIAVPAGYFFEGIEGGREDIYRAVHEMMKRPDRPTAFFAAVDIIGIYVMDQLLRDGFRIPGDASVIGIGNMGISRYDMISLSTIDEDRSQMGRSAARIILNQIENPGTRPERIHMAGQLVQRRSTAPPKAE